MHFYIVSETANVSGLEEVSNEDEVKDSKLEEKINREMTEDICKTDVSKSEHPQLEDTSASDLSVENEPKKTESEEKVPEGEQDTHVIEDSKVTTKEETKVVPDEIENDNSTSGVMKITNTVEEILPPEDLHESESAEPELTKEAEIIEPNPDCLKNAEGTEGGIEQEEIEVLEKEENKSEVNCVEETKAEATEDEAMTKEDEVPNPVSTKLQTIEPSDQLCEQNEYEEPDSKPEPTVALEEDCSEGQPIFNTESEEEAKIKDESHPLEIEAIVIEEQENKPQSPCNDEPLQDATIVEIKPTTEPDPESEPAFDREEKEEMLATGGPQMDMKNADTEKKKSEPQEHEAVVIEEQKENFLTHCKGETKTEAAYAEEGASEVETNHRLSKPEATESEELDQQVVAEPDVSIELESEEDKLEPLEIEAEVIEEQEGNLLTQCDADTKVDAADAEDDSSEVETEHELSKPEASEELEQQAVTEPHISVAAAPKIFDTKNAESEEDKLEPLEIEAEAIEEQEENLLTQCDAETKVDAADAEQDPQDPSKVETHAEGSALEATPVTVEGETEQLLEKSDIVKSGELQQSQYELQETKSSNEKMESSSELESSQLNDMSSTCIEVIDEVIEPVNAKPEAALIEEQESLNVNNEEPELDKEGPTSNKDAESVFNQLEQSEILPYEENELASAVGHKDGGVPGEDEMQDSQPEVEANEETVSESKVQNTLEKAMPEMSEDTDDTVHPEVSEPLSIIAESVVETTKPENGEAEKTVTDNAFNGVNGDHQNDIKQEIKDEPDDTKEYYIPVDYETYQKWLEEKGDDKQEVQIDTDVEVNKKKVLGKFMYKCISRKMK